MGQPARAAHTWAITTNNLAVADSLVTGTGPHAWCRLRHEHGEWATRNVSLDTSDRPANPTSYAWSAYWAFIGGDQDAAIESARCGIDSAPRPEHPDTTWCWATLVWAYLGSGRGALAQEPARYADLAAATNPDPFAQSWSHIAQIEAALGGDIPTLVGRVARYAAWAGKVGSPSLLARAAFYQGMIKQFAQHPPDHETALVYYQDGLDLCRKACDINNEGKNLLGVVSAATRLQRTEAAKVSREALSRLHDNRHWSVLWPALDIVARWFAAIGNAEGAGVVYGHLDVHHPPWDNVPMSRARTRGLEVVRQHPGVERFMARGAAMGPDEVVNFVLDHLARSAGPPNGGCASPP